MSLFDEPFEIFWTPIGRVGSVEQNTVVTPVALARKVRHGHDFNRRHPQRNEVIEFRDRSNERALIGESPHVQFIDNGFRPGPIMPSRVTPFEFRWIDNFAWTMYIVWLEP